MTIEQVISKEDQIYRDLQIHIDNQALTYPELKSGAEIRVSSSLRVCPMSENQGRIMRRRP